MSEMGTETKEKERSAVDRTKAEAWESQETVREGETVMPTIPQETCEGMDN
jgi:hypothetical protein